MAATATQEPKITDPDAVVFRFDGEQTTPADVIANMQKYQEEQGYEQDTYSLGGTVEALEKKAAEVLGTEAAMFVPTGTLANHLAVRRHCGTKGRAVIQEQAHLFVDSGDTVQRLSGINMIPLAEGRVYFTADELRAAYKRSVTSRVMNPIGCVIVETPVRRQGGQIVPFEELKAITDFCREEGIPSHLDGSRLFMMTAATGIPPRDYAALFDTTYFSLYKYFGAPFGAILGGTSKFVEGLYHDRRMFGSGLPTTTLVAGLALQGMDGFEERFTAALRKAMDLFDGLNQLEAVSIQPFEHYSNIFPMKLAQGIDANDFAARLKKRSVFVFPEEEAFGDSTLLHVNTTIMRRPNEDIVGVFEEALS
ncbi:MAG: aminotransferase class I/II-fold pyridoxal phosphate-dependent enzyme [Chloroflexi bacterium]|nr:aminotransferase class I/II-fold pyridoxal phosphate-dependent enzyme [Chloroflexota bacterium]